MKTILVVDDEEASAEVLGLILEDEGYRVYTAPNGLLGLDRAREVKPALVILDFMMPVMTGAELGQRLRSLPEFADLQIIMNSSMPEEVVRARFDGYDVFLRKPYDVDAALAAIRELIG